jgi:TonB-dependent SusC/RagA subfamily outer membrane receptor
LHQAVKSLLMPTKLLQLFATLSICFLQSTAQPVKDEPILLQHCAINVDANIFTATTTLQLEFYNPNSKILDGEYSFGLQAGQVITGFVLDINGQLREGVIVDKQQGRVAYENTIRRRIDPGLLEMTTGNNYRVRIYPMPARGTRKIKITISQLLVVKDDNVQYYLPLDISYPVQQLHVTCSVVSGSEKPFAVDGVLKGRNFENVHNKYVLSFEKKNLELKQPLSFKLPLQRKKYAIDYCEKENEKPFALHVKAPADIFKLKALNSVTVFWDVSSSAIKRDIKKEITFLESFVKARMVKGIILVTFSNAIHEVKKINAGNSGFGAIRRFLESQSFDGGTQLGTIDCNKYNTDGFLMFSDGLSNFGSDKLKGNSKPLYCVNSAVAANHTALKRIALSASGAYIDLSATSTEAAMQQLQTNAPQLLSVKQDGKELTVNTALPFQSSGWLTLTGKIQNNKDDIVLGFGKEGVVEKEEPVSLPANSKCTSGVLDTAGLLQIYDALVNNVADGEETTAFSKYHRFVSSTSSFIVLDNIDDYIQYGIEPPADLQKEYLQKIYVVKQKEEELKNALANEEINNLRNAATLYNERINWWAKNETLISLKDVEMKKEAIVASDNNNSSTNDNSTNANSNTNTNENNGLLKGSQALDEVVVVGYGTVRKRSLTGSVVTINSRELSSAKSVSQALQGRVAGVQVIQSSTPGTADKIFIRGAGSVNGNNEPLYILDGMPIDGNYMSSLNVNDIESVSVIKDISAAAIYGSRAVNGVIVMTTKRGTRNNQNRAPGVVKYKDLEDVEYINELKEADKHLIYLQYLQMKDSFEKDASFYFDVAQLLSENDEKDKAVRVLSNLSEMDNENHQLLRAMGYIFESWGMYADAIEVYKKVLAIKEEEPQSYRDLALAYERSGQHQLAVEALYKVITKNFYQYENRYRGIKSLLLNEMNAIISQQHNNLDLSKINPAIIKPLPVDLRIVVDWNKDETDIDLHIVEPDGEECFYSYKQSKNGGRLSEDFTQGYGPEEYQIKNVQKGKYSIRINYYGDRYQKQQTPSVIKLTIYKNFGRANQTVSVETFLMDSQSGKIEIADVKF